MIAVILIDDRFAAEYEIDGMRVTLIDEADEHLGQTMNRFRVQPDGVIVVHEKADVGRVTGYLVDPTKVRYQERQDLNVLDSID